MIEIDLVVFDMAGTTVEDRGQVPAAFTDALSAHGITLSTDEVAGVRGASKREAIRTLVARHRPGAAGSDGRAEEIYLAFRRQLEERYASERPRPVPGAAESFAWLRERGVRVALSTGFDRAVTDLLLHALGWADGTVDAVVCGDDVAQGRPAPYLIFRAMEATRAASVHRVASVGDTALDLRAGANAGVRWNVGVLSGAHTRERLRSEPHSHLLGSVAEVPRLWDPDAEDPALAPPPHPPQLSAGPSASPDPEDGWNRRDRRG